MSLLVNAVACLRAETGASICVVHHSGKDTSRGSRGSTVLPCAVDTVIEVSKDATTKIATVHLNKQRDGATGELLNFSLKVIELGTDADGDPITSCVIEATDAKPAKTTTPKQRRALDALHNVLADHGQRAPDATHYPATQVVPVDLWREQLFKAGVLEQNASNPRADFKRLKDQLAERGLISEWNSLMWAANPTEG